MNRNDLYKAMNEVDDDILERSEAVAYVRKKKNKRLHWGGVAAVLCFVILGIALWKQSAPSHKKDTGITISENGITIPPMEVSLSADVEADMIGFFIYQGRCYVQYEWIYDAVDIVGEHLGTATGLIDEWTPKDGYVECAGSVRGDFYAVKGYDPSFMLCMKYENGAVQTYICNTGITLKYGSELYEDRLHLSENIKSMQYESYRSWYSSRGELYQMNRVTDLVMDFIQELDSAEFIWYDSVPFEVGQKTMIGAELYHLYFQMQNGTTIRLCLHENGYVRFQGLERLCVQVSEESYHELLNLLDHHIHSTAVDAPEVTGPTFEDCLNDAEFGPYVPTYVPEDFYFASAELYYYLDRQTADETGIKEIMLNYEHLENPGCCYTITITWAEEYGNHGWAGPMIDAADLNVETISELIKTSSSGSGNWLGVGVWHDNVSVELYAQDVDAETAFEILNSIP